MRVVILDDWDRFYFGNENVARLKEHFDVDIYHDRPVKEVLIESCRAPILSFRLEGIAVTGTKG